MLVNCRCAYGQVTGCWRDTQFSTPFSITSQNNIQWHKTSSCDITRRFTNTFILIKQYVRFEWLRDSRCCEASVTSFLLIVSVSLGVTYDSFQSSLENASNEHITCFVALGLLSFTQIYPKDSLMGRKILYKCLKCLEGVESRVQQTKLVFRNSYWLTDVYIFFHLKSSRSHAHVFCICLHGHHNQN